MTISFIRIVVLISVATLLSFGNSCSQQATAPVERSPSAKGPARVEQADDAKIKQLLKPKGKPLLVNFWATWCGPCREEFPDLVAIDDQYRAKIDFITISLDSVEDIKNAVPQFLGEMNAQMPTFVLVSSDENALISTISKDWSGALPFTILYGEKGEIVYQRQGKVDTGILNTEIRNAIE